MKRTQMTLKDKEHSKVIEKNSGLRQKNRLIK